MKRAALNANFCLVVVSESRIHQVARQVYRPPHTLHQVRALALAFLHPILLLFLRDLVRRLLTLKSVKIIRGYLSVFVMQTTRQPLFAARPFLKMVGNLWHVIKETKDSFPLLAPMNSSMKFVGMSALLCRSVDFP
jgi:hypothetical protein